MTVEKFISFNKNLPNLQDFYTKVKLNEEISFQEKRHFELLFVRAVSSCNYNQVNYLAKNLFSDIMADGFNNLLLIHYTVSTITLLTRVAITEGVCEREAYSLSEAYLSMDFKKIKVTPRELIFEISRNFLLLIEKAKCYKYESQIVNEVINYIRNNINKKLTNNSIANHLHITPEYLSYHFKSVTNINLKSFINQEKIEFAKYLLTSTDLSLLEITINLGYSDQSYFTKVFKKYTKKTPSEYRKNGIVNY